MPSQVRMKPIKIFLIIILILIGLKIFLNLPFNSKESPKKIARLKQQKEKISPELNLEEINNLLHPKTIFIYDAKGRRDPFSPLITKYRSKKDSQAKIQKKVQKEILLVGIVWSKELPSALLKIKGETKSPIIAYKDDRIKMEEDEIKIIDIKEDRIVVSKEGKEIVLKVREKGRD
jgi:hypothetical protein